MQKNQRNARFMAAWKEIVIVIEFCEKYNPGIYTVDNSENRNENLVDIAAPKHETAGPPLSNSVEISSSVAQKTIFLGNGNVHNIKLKVKAHSNIVVTRTKRRIKGAALQSKPVRKTMRHQLVEAAT